VTSASGQAKTTLAMSHDGMMMMMMVIMMYAGHDTTASGVSWCLYHLAKHPDCQRKARDEVDEVLKGRDVPDILWSVAVCCFASC